MITINTIKEMVENSLSKKREGKTIGFVPTMGYLHDGHISLVRKARETSDWVVVSIFVNPTQFGRGEDLSRYPRDIERDSLMCAKAGVDVLFVPSVGEMYAPDHSIYVDETDVSLGLCGASRPGHFRGVATIVAKLFNIVMPDSAVFGQKDAQQARVIEKLVADLNINVKVIVAPIVRDPDGLAMSSRNKYLTADDRKNALSINRALKLAEDMFKGGVDDAGTVKSKMCELMEKSGLLIDYVEIVDRASLKPVERIVDGALAAVAAKVGATRLIDNTTFHC